MISKRSRSLLGMAHWVRDVTGVRTTPASAPATDLRSWPPCATPQINIIRLHDGTNIAAAHRAFSYRPADVLDALNAA